MPRPTTLQFGAQLSGSGGTSPGNPLGQQPDFRLYAEVAQALEGAGFSAIVVAEAAAIGGDDLTTSSEYFEPLTLASALSAVTERIGLVATASTSHNEPYTIARKLASLDHISGGRAGWNVLTGAPLEASDEKPYERAAEFVDVVTGLWDSYTDDAVIRDKESGIYFRQEGRQKLDHRGEHFRVDGPLNVSRPPQGHPVIFQAETSESGRALAAQHGDVIVIAPPDIETAVSYRKRLDAALVDLGRDPGDVRLWSTLTSLGAETGAATIADRLEAWFASEAVDGFIVSFSNLPDDAERFLAEVLPLLEARGIFAPASGPTLRESLGLPRPVGRVLEP